MRAVRRQGGVVLGELWKAHVGQNGRAIAGGELSLVCCAADRRRPAERRRPAAQHKPDAQTKTKQDVERARWTPRVYASLIWTRTKASAVYSVYLVCKDARS